MANVTISGGTDHTIRVDGERVGEMRRTWRGGGSNWRAVLTDPRTGDEMITANHPNYRVAAHWVRQDLESFSVEQAIDRYPRRVAGAAE